ncbi:hypothetical protein CEXT_181721 [Caerostris extrusa]|uniref:Uncharacterized protein n=1 Tax=Caerostris extrusa TaxID=172846 RepID=A0AAV4VEW7_CAEEX|nr:hypothetical protein CEXT_181721 [Caerostris extrusa]
MTFRLKYPKEEMMCFQDVFFILCLNLVEVIERNIVINLALFLFQTFCLKYPKQMMYMNYRQELQTILEIVLDTRNKSSAHHY